MGGKIKNIKINGINRNLVISSQNSSKNSESKKTKIKSEFLAE
jgi:hypothetical protein